MVNDHWGWSCQECNTTNGHLHRWCVVCGALRGEEPPTSAGVLRPGPIEPRRGQEVLLATFVLLALVVIGTGTWFLARERPDGPAESASTEPSTVGPGTTATTVPLEERAPVVAWLYPSARYGDVATVAARVSDEGYRSGTVASFAITPPSTVIYYREGRSDVARSVAELLRLPGSAIQRAPDDLEAPVRAGDDVIVILGNDWIDSLDDS